MGLQNFINLMNSTNEELEGDLSTVDLSNSKLMPKDQQAVQKLQQGYSALSNKAKEAIQNQKKIQTTMPQKDKKTIDMVSKQTQNLNPEAKKEIASKLQIDAKTSLKQG